MAIIVSFVWMIIWLFELILSSFIISIGAEKLSHYLSGRFVGRTILSITTTLPEILIVIYASRMELYGVSLGSALGSNILMMSLGLALMTLIATTSLSKRPMGEIKVEGFKLDMAFLIATAILSVLMFIDGYNLLDAIVFMALFFLYIVFAFIEGGKRTEREIYKVANKLTARYASIYIALFIIGGLGLLLGAEPFIKSVEEIAIGMGVPAAIIAVVLSPIAGELPEKFSMMILASKGGEAVSISVANVLGSKILNNTLLLACMIFGAAYFHEPGVVIKPDGLLIFMVYWTAILTIIATSLMFDRALSRRDGTFLTLLYIASVAIQFIFLTI